MPGSYRTIAFSNPHALRQQQLLLTWQLRYSSTFLLMQCYFCFELCPSAYMVTALGTLISTYDHISERYKTRHSLSNKRHNIFS